MESIAIRTFGVRKATHWLKVSWDQHSELQVVATRGYTGKNCAMISDKSLKLLQFCVLGTATVLKARVAEFAVMLQ